MRTRPASAEHVSGVVALERALFGPDAWSPAGAAEELTGPGRLAFVASDEAGSVVVGYAVGRVFGDAVDLHRVAVSQAHRRSGVGRALLDEVRRAARADGATRMLLEVAADSCAALAFYAAEGFTQIDRRRRYYRDGSDALVLCGGVGAPAGGGATVPDGARR